MIVYVHVNSPGSSRITRNWVWGIQKVHGVLFLMRPISVDHHLFQDV